MSYTLGQMTAAVEFCEAMEDWLVVKPLDEAKQSPEYQRKVEAWQRWKQLKEQA
jgi:hypothetical protein